MRIIQVVAEPHRADEPTTRRSTDGTYDVVSYEVVTYHIHVDMSDLTPQQRTAVFVALGDRHWSYQYSTYEDVTVSIQFPQAEVLIAIPSPEQAAQWVEAVINAC